MPSKMEDTKETETPATDQVDLVVESNEPYEAQGARPKQPPAIKYDIRFIESFKPEVCGNAILEISEQNGLIFTGYFQARLETKDVRIVSKFEYDTGKKECIHLSFYNNDEDCVSSIFFEALNASDTDAYLATLQDFMKKRLAPHCTSEDSLNNAMAVLKKQPVFIGWVKSTVQEKKDGEQAKLEAPPSDATEYLVIVDLECVSWYLSKTVKPVFQLMFWMEARPKSIETVKHHHGQQFILFDAKKMAIIIEAQQSIIRNMRILRPKKVNFMKDIKEFLEFVPVVQQESPFFLRDEQSDYDDTVAASAPTYETPSEMEAFRGELESAMEQFKENEEFQSFWLSQQIDLQELVKDGKVPRTDSSSGGLDPNSEEHFKKALTDVTDQLTEGNMALAMSRVTAARDLYKYSPNEDIRRFLEDLDDMEILKRLYFKSMVQ